MTCAACAQELCLSIAPLQDVLSVQINPASHWMDLQLAATAVPSDVMARVDEAMQAHGCHLLDDSVQAQRDASRRSVRQSLFRLLLAALLWMQVMMYAWPEYSHGVYSADGLALALDDLTAQDRTLLRWAQWMLSLPLMIFCARPVFRSAWQGLRRRQPGLDLPAAFALIAAFAVSTQATFSGQGPVWFDSLSMFLLFLLLARHLTESLRHRSLMAVLDAQPDLPPAVTRRDADGEWKSVDTDDLSAGDVCLARSGDVLAADGTLLSGDALFSESPVSGEDMPVRHRAGDAVFAGSRLIAVDGATHIQYRVTATGMNTAVGQICQSLVTAVSHRSDRLQWADRFAIPLMLALLGVSVLAGVWAEWSVAGSTGVEEGVRGWSVGLAVLMVSCPCAISLAAPMAWIAATLRLRQDGLMVRNTNALQALPDITDVVFDKTGTLTDALSVACVKWFERETAHATKDPTEDATEHATGMVRSMASSSAHPLSRALVQWAQRGETLPLTECTETAGHGLHAMDDAGLQWRLGSAQWCGLQCGLEVTGARENEGCDITHVFLACRTGQDGAEKDVSPWRLVCRFDVQSGLRDGVGHLIDYCRQEGLRLHLWSGDHPQAVGALAARLNIQDARAQMSPADKLHAMECLRQAGARVLMVGDGLNDAPAIAAADVSLAMGSGSQMAQMNADVLVLEGRIAGIENLLAVSHRLKQTIRTNMAWAVAYNAVAVPLAATGILTPLSAGVGMALSSVCVTLNALRLLRSREHASGNSGDVAVKAQRLEQSAQSMLTI